MSEVPLYRVRAPGTGTRGCLSRCPCPQTTQKCWSTQFKSCIVHMRSNFRGFGLIPQSFGEVLDVTGANPYNPRCRLGAPTFFYLTGKGFFSFDLFFFVATFSGMFQKNACQGFDISVFFTRDQPPIVCCKRQGLFLSVTCKNHGNMKLVFAF